MNIVINQQPSSLTASDRSAPETRVRNPGRQTRGKKSNKTHMKKLKQRLLKDNQESHDLKRIYRIFSARSK